MPIAISLRCQVITLYFLAIAIGLTGCYSDADRGKRDRGPFRIQILDDTTKAPIPGGFIMISSYTDRTVWINYKIERGPWGLFRTDNTGTVVVPSDITQHGRLDISVWAPTYSAEQYNRFSLRPKDRSTPLDYLRNRDDVDNHTQVQLDSSKAAVITLKRLIPGSTVEYANVVKWIISGRQEWLRAVQDPSSGFFPHSNQEQNVITDYDGTLLKELTKLTEEAKVHDSKIKVGYTDRGAFRIRVLDNDLKSRVSGAVVLTTSLTFMSSVLSNWDEKGPIFLQLSDKDGEIEIPAELNKESDLQITIWAKGYRSIATRRTHWVCAPQPFRERFVPNCVVPANNQISISEQSIKRVELNNKADREVSLREISALKEKILSLREQIKSGKAVEYTGSRLFDLFVTRSIGEAEDVLNGAAEIQVVQ
ncbi:MAG: hypothetical protein AAB156_05550 [Pseudomonadota bacterium]